MERFRTHACLAIAFSAAIGVSACDGADPPAAGAAPPATAPDASTADAGEPSPGPAPADTVDAVAVVERVPAADAGAGFDAKAFAGTYVADGAALDVSADGRYTLAVRAESADASLESTGTWTMEADGTRIRLDPDAKADADRVFELRDDGTLAADDGGWVLRRDAG